MLGHKLAEQLSPNCDLSISTRSKKSLISNLPWARETNIYEGVDLTSDFSLKELLRITEPDAVINCAGIVKQKIFKTNQAELQAINCELPKKLEIEASKGKFRLIQISSDCVFSGAKGKYSELDMPDASDDYGNSKLAGEVISNNCLTIRTSFIGRQLKGEESLLEWFLSNSAEEIRGYSNCYFSGLSCKYLAKELQNILFKYQDLEGRIHLGGPRISKYELLNEIAKHLELKKTILPDSTIRLDRSLDSSRYQRLTGYKIPTWQEMAEDLISEVPQYEGWRRS